jgi:hypothetical protein
MPRDDIAFRSQEFAQRATESVQPAQQNMLRSLEHFSQTVGQAMQIRQQGRQISMQQQELEMRKDLASSSIALDRIRKQQAVEELNWSRELHTTAMLENERRVSTANADLAIANASEAQQKLNKPAVDHTKLSDYEMARILAFGEKFDPKSGAVVSASPEEQAYGQWFLDRRERFIESQIEANKGRAAGSDADRASREKIAGGRLGSAEDKTYLDSIETELSGLQLQRENAVKTPPKTPAEKEARAKKVADIDQRIEDLTKKASELRNVKAAAPGGTEDVPDTALDAMMMQILQSQQGQR